MAKNEIVLPAMGEGIIEATITNWLKSVGENVEEDESLVEIATDKVDSEIPSPVNGVVEKILFKEGDVPKIGDIIAIINDGKENENSTEISTEIAEKDSKEEIEIKTEEIPGIQDIKIAASVPDINTDSLNQGFLSPLVKSIIKKENISSTELSKINGTGKDGRITKDDLFSYLKTRTEDSFSKEISPNTEAKVNVTPNIFIGEGDEIVEMDRMRKLIADYMVKSKQISPHVTTFHEVDVTNIVNWRNKVKDEFLVRQKEKLTYTPIFFEAAAQVLTEMPMVNISVDGYKIIKRKHVNIGMATALPNGNLIVPVIRDADQKNLIGLAKTVNDLSNRARNNKLKPDEIQGGTFTITNFGSFGNLTGSPIINQPEVAILGLGAILKKPAVIETTTGDAIGIRHKIILSLAYDHRVVDGALGGMFLKRLAEILESFDIERSI